MAQWHVLGVGSIGQLFAHHLRLNGANVTLLLRSKEALSTFQDAGESISVQRRRSDKGNATSGAPMTTETAYETQVSSGYRAEVAGASSSDNGDCIANLLVTVKAHQTADAIALVRERLSSSSNLVLLQNGMGVEREVRDCLLGCKHGRGGLPQIILGVTTHGCRPSPSAPFSVLHTTVTGGGEVSFSEAEEAGEPGHTQAALRSLEQLTALHVRIRPRDAVERMRWDKLLVNCCINPLTALLGCRNGDLLLNPQAQDLMREVCREGAAVLSATNPASDRGACQEGSAALAKALEVAAVTADNRSSMLQDVDRGQSTEIEYMNGYLVRAAAEVGLSAPVNKTLCDLVVAKTAAASVSYTETVR